MRIALTGSSGKLGTVVARELRENGYDVISMDLVGERGPSFVQVDLTDYGQVIDAFPSVGDRRDGIDAADISARSRHRGYALTSQPSTTT